LAQPIVKANINISGSSFGSDDSGGFNLNLSSDEEIFQQSPITKPSSPARVFLHVTAPTPPNSSRASSSARVSTPISITSPPVARAPSLTIPESSSSFSASVPSPSYQAFNIDGDISGLTPASSTPACSPPASSPPASSPPASSAPASSPPASSPPASSTPASSTPASLTPASSTPAYSSSALPSCPAVVSKNVAVASTFTSFPASSPL